MTASRILAIDPGTTTGWAVGQVGEPDTCGAWHLPHTKGRAGLRFAAFRAELARVLPGAGLVVFEQVARHEGTAAAHVYGGLVAILSEACEGLSIPYAGYIPSRIKKHATGHGGAHKPAMIASARARACWARLDVTDDNVADALWLLDLARVSPPPLPAWSPQRRRGTRRNVR